MPITHTVRLGSTNTYLVRGKTGWLLVDTGIRGKEHQFFRHLEQLGIEPEQIRLIVITHGHFDHVGALGAIKARCGCPAAVHRLDAPLLVSGRIEIPPGITAVGRLFSRIGRKHPVLMSRLYRFEAVEPEISVTTEMNLTEIGFPVRLIPTPGHTAGSLTVLARDGKAFVGDLAFNVLRGMGGYLPPFGDDAETIRDSLRRIRESGARKIYPAHGFPFAANRLGFR